MWVSQNFKLNDFHVCLPKSTKQTTQTLHEFWTLYNTALSKCIQLGTLSETFIEHNSVQWQILPEDKYILIFIKLTSLDIF